MFRNDQIGKMLKKYRKLNSLSVTEVACELAERYDQKIAEKSIYGWESNKASPSAPMLLALCDIYKVNSVTDAFSDSSESKGFPITPEERLLIENYRTHKAMQPVVRKLLDLPSKSR